MRDSSVSSRPERKCCLRKGTESSNMVATPWSCTILENAELWECNERGEDEDETDNRKFKLI